MLLSQDYVSIIVTLQITIDNTNKQNTIYLQDMMHSNRFH